MYQLQERHYTGGYAVTPARKQGPGLTELVTMWSKASNSTSGRHELRWEDSHKQSFYLCIERIQQTAPCQWTLKISCDDGERNFSGDSVSRLWELCSAMSAG